MTRSRADSGNNAARPRHTTTPSDTSAAAGGGGPSTRKCPLMTPFSRAIAVADVPGGQEAFDLLVRHYLVHDTAPVD